MFLDKPATNEEINSIRLFHDRVIVPSRFEFMREICGLRPRCLMGLLGTAGSGKSTITKTLIADAAERTKVLIYLTEEDPKEYQVGLNKIKTNLDNIVFCSEKKISHAAKSFEEMKLFFGEIILSSGAKVVFLDNITTSSLYEPLSVRMQGEFVTYLANLAEKNDLCIFYVAHTRKEVTDNMGRLIEGEDARGSNQLFQQSQYFFILQNIAINNDLYPILRIRKHRFHEITKRFFLLGYKEGAYRFDRYIEFERIAEIFKERNQLKR